MYKIVNNSDALKHYLNQLELNNEKQIRDNQENIRIISTFR